MSECKYLRGSCPVGCERSEEVKRSCWLYWQARAEDAESLVDDVGLALTGARGDRDMERARADAAEKRVTDLEHDLADAEKRALRAERRAAAEGGYRTKGNYLRLVRDRDAAKAGGSPSPRP